MQERERKEIIDSLRSTSPSKRSVAHSGINRFRPRRYGLPVDPAQDSEDLRSRRWKGARGIEGGLVAGLELHDHVKHARRVELLGYADVCESGSQITVCFTGDIFTGEAVVNDELAVASIG